SSRSRYLRSGRSRDVGQRRVAERDRLPNERVVAALRVVVDGDRVARRVVPVEPRWRRGLRDGVVTEREAVDADAAIGAGRLGGREAVRSRDRERGSRERSVALDRRLADLDRAELQLVRVGTGDRVIRLDGDVCLERVRGVLAATWSAGEALQDEVGR